MKLNWTPKSHISKIEGGMVIEAEVGNIRAASVAIAVEGSQLRVQGQHDRLGDFECKFEVPPDYSPVTTRVSFASGILRIEMPQSTNSFGFGFHRTMTIQCSDCGEPFDVIFDNKGSQVFCCPACGKMDDFDVQASVNWALEQGKKILRKDRVAK